ncbi:MAG: TonB-dependent receptor [Candidatus Pseudobacter hemicellulosilyticus]|uniref:TonB-dependent receptor n=1 Tax=Candidatus Pseudobacter hemicellulosilyticus TaxID=3121375 RepID=A0AAJ5WQ21_9BACT|nr:MAG: TonB-dependent receptor [Pseudobacter sp.]
MRKTADGYRRSADLLPVACPGTQPLLTLMRSLPRAPIRPLRKFTALLLTFAMLNVYAGGLSQTVSFSGKKVPLKQVFETVTSQTGYTVLSMHAALDNAKPVSIEASSLPLSQFLAIALKNQPFTYKILHNTVVISAKPPVVTLNVKNESLAKVFQLIREQTGLDLLYNDQVKAESTLVTINVKEVSLEEALDKLFTGLNLEYRIGQKEVIISVKPGTRMEVKPVAANANTISGRVLNEKGLPLQGATVKVKNSQQPVLADERGEFILTRVPDSATLEVSFVGFRNQEVLVNNRKSVDIVLVEQTSALNEVVVVAFGQQKKESMVSSITTISPKELKGPTSNLTTMMAGRLAGVISYQRSGEPGADNASFFIRGITSFGSGKLDPYILIDGMESTPTNLARLQPDDIAAFSVLKDAAASSLYGARGANGVILVTTKSGVAGKTKFNVRFENSLSGNTENFRMADNITYMQLANEAVLTRSPKEALPYSQNKIDATIAGENPMLYPSNDWMGLLIKDRTMNQRLNANLTGGGKGAQYYIAATYNQDNGVLKKNNLNSFDNNIKLKSYEIRSNVTVNLTPTTIAVVRTSGNFDDYTGPVGGFDANGNRINGGSVVFNSVLRSNPVLFPAVFDPSDSPYDNHPLFGNAMISQGSNTFYNNPYAAMVSGYQEYSTSTLNVQLELQQDFKFITPGLKGRVMAYTRRYSYFDLSRQYTPFYYAASPTKENEKGYRLNLLNPTTATEYLNYSPDQSAKIQNTTGYMEAALNYKTTIGQLHNLSGMVIGIMRNHLNGSASTLQTSLPARNLGVSGRLTYDYDSRYLFEGNFGYNGSERFAKNNRFGFFPSAGIGWVASNEKFWKPVEDIITNLKLRGTYGLVGNDQIGYSSDRFFYLSEVSLNDASRRATFGENFGYTRNGVNISRYANENITWEISKEINVGMDLTLFNRLNVVVDFFRKKRSNILMPRAFIPATMGLTATTSANVGAASSKGIDLALDYSNSWGDFWLSARGTFTYAVSRLDQNEEPEYAENMYYLSRLGHPLVMNVGLIAERLFVDDDDVKNSPKQVFGEVMGGDIKYRDLNGDGQITNLDRVNGLGHSASPEIVYGFGFSSGYKGFELSAFFQGSARTSIYMDPSQITPFVISGSNQNGLLDIIAKDHWSEDNQNIYAFWPRLSPTVNANNAQPSSWWLRNGAFLRLKQVELAYNIPAKSLARLKVSGLRVYVNANNLFKFTSFKLWDPEQGSNGLGYPVQKVYNMGVRLEI